MSAATPFSSGPSDRPDDTATVLAAGVLAATLAAVFHETIGHGIGCAAIGGDVTLLTSIWYRCHGATSLTDAGGAIAGVMAIIGVLAYAAIVRWIAVLLRSAAAPGPRAIRLAYLGSAVSAAFAGQMWSPEPIHSAVEGLLTLGAAPLGLLGASSSRAEQKHAGAGTIARSWSFLVLALVIFAAFALVQGRGLGPLANVALRQ